MTNIESETEQFIKKDMLNRPQQERVEEVIAKSPSAQETDQIIAVVASGTRAMIYLLEKNDNDWKTTLSTEGFVGKAGVGQAYESSLRTPQGAYNMSLAFGIAENPGSLLPYRQITPTSYWVSNVNDPQYNTWQERESSDKADEHLITYTEQYQYAIALDYDNGVGGGSAFFLHVTNGEPTHGCVAVSLEVMRQFITRVREGARIINVNSVEEIVNY